MPELSWIHLPHWLHVAWNVSLMISGAIMLIGYLFGWDKINGKRYL